ncbi:MAG: DMT family transporter [Pseudomonadota bacterium]
MSPKSILTHHYLLLTITALIWGGNAVAGKLAVGHISPFLLTLLRWGVACIVLAPFAIPHVKRDWPVIRKNLPFLMALGAIGFGIFNNLMYLALNYTTAINVAIEQGSMPLIVFALNYLLFRTKVTIYQVVGFIITIIGVVLTATRGNIFSLHEQAVNFGDLIMLLAVMVYGIYSVFLKKKPDIHLISLLSVLGVSAFLGTIPFALYEVSTQTMQWPDAQGWGVVIYAALFPSLFSQLFWVMGLEKIGSNRGGVFINLVPIFGALLAIVILGEQFQLYHGIALILVLGGIALAQKAHNDF